MAVICRIYGEDGAHSKTKEYDSLVDTLELQTRRAAASTPEPTQLSLPSGPTQSIGPYSHAVRIYDGLFSAIFCSQALHASTQPRLVALKVTPLSGVNPPHDPIREARLLHQTLPHSNILPFIEKFNIPDNFVLVTPYYPYDLGSSLEKKVIHGEAGLVIIKDILKGLAHIHSAGVIHRDIKPSNILLKSLTGGVVIADFGIAWKEGDPNSEKADCKITDIGTTCYRAPELLFGYKKYGVSVDMWAAGCVFAEIVDSRNRPLFEAGDLGSELRLLSDMFQKLGTPTVDTWPEAGEFPDFGKLQFLRYEPKPWSALVETERTAYLDLLQKLVKYGSTERLTASEALKHNVFKNLPVETA